MIISKLQNSTKHQYKAEFKNLDGSEVLSSDFSGLGTSAASLTSLASATSMPQKPYFTKELPSPDCWIVPGPKMTNTGPFLLNEPSQIQIFTNILYPFCQRLLRPADVIFLKTG